jgi:8-oxo-dGTP pyrophosphatase MutT (NUDIX family)
VDYIRELRALVGHRPLVLAVAGALVFDADGRLLLHRRDDNGLWGTSGGAVEPGESLEETARRELREETGLEVRLLDTIGTYAAKSAQLNRLSTLTVTFAGEVVSGSLKSSIEGRPCWLDEGEMREALSSHYAGMLEDYLAHRERHAQS